MINLYNAHIETLSVHQVGNKSKQESPFLSESPCLLSDELSPLLKEFFLKPFRDKEENYFQFSHEGGLDQHTMFSLAHRLFANPDDLHAVSVIIAEHLFDQSNHPHIKNGEVYVAYFSGITIDNQPTDVIGIFKSELQSDFLQLHQTEKHLDMVLQQGTNLQKLDKGCLIFNVHQEEGYKVLSVDSNRYDTRYWLEHFLGLSVFEDDHFFTKKYLKFCQHFAKDVVLPAEDKKQEVLFMNRSVNYFAKNNQFEESTFLDQVIENPDLIPEFKSYKVDKGQKFSIEDITTFPIANSAVSDARKTIKNVINLDTNIQIKLDFVHAESADRFVEKGWDEERQMYYYLVYFNKEHKS